jgi:hypothetical protein
LLPSPAIAMVEGWSFQDHRFIEHEDDRARACPQPPLKPPLACRHGGERRARQCRGRFQRKPKRSMAALTLCPETVMSCSAQRYCANNDAVQTVDR